MREREREKESGKATSFPSLCRKLFSTAASERGVLVQLLLLVPNAVLAREGDAKRRGAAVKSSFWFGV